MIALLLLACGADRPPVATLEPAGRLLFHDVAIYEGTGPGRLEHQDVQVDGGRITALGPTGGPLPEGARLIKGAGQTLLPGLIDAHTHVTAPLGPPWKFIPADPGFVLETQLRAGVTTVYDMAGDPDELRALTASISSGEQAAPRLLWTASSITWPGAHPIASIEALLPGPLAGVLTRKILVAAGPDEAAARVASVKAAGGQFVKIIYDSEPPSAPHMSKATLGALITAAHAEGLKVAVHIGTIEDALDAATAGADLLAHGPSRGQVTDEQAAALAATGAPVVATLYGFGTTWRLAEGSWQPSEMDRRLIPAEILAPVTGEAGREFGEIPVLAELAAGVNHDMGANIARLRRAGVPILTGTDSPLPADYPGSGLHNELDALVEQAGLTPAEALQAATGDAATALVEDPDFGRIAVGKRADLLLVKGDPTADIQAVHDVQLVVREGRIVRQP